MVIISILGGMIIVLVVALVIGAYYLGKCKANKELDMHLKKIYEECSKRGV